MTEMHYTEDAMKAQLRAWGRGRPRADGGRGRGGNWRRPRRANHSPPLCLARAQPA